MKSNFVCLMISYEISSILSRLIVFPKDLIKNAMYLESSNKFLDLSF